MLYLLQHGIGFNLLLDGHVWNSQHAVDDVQIPIGRCNVTQNDCCIDAASLHRDCLIVIVSVGDDVEVQELFVGTGWDLVNLWKGKTKFRYTGFPVAYRKHVTCFCWCWCAMLILREL